MSTPSAYVRKVGDAAFVAAFLAAIAAPAVASLGEWAPRASLDEKRRLAPPPEFRLRGRALAAFPAAFEAYFNDHFAFRDQLIAWRNRVVVQASGVSTNPSVLVGKNGWFYYVPQAMEEYRAETDMPQDELVRWDNLLMQCQTGLAAQGTRFLVVVAPDCQSIYPEYLPPSEKSSGRPTHLDQVLAYIRGHSRVPVVDLRGPLRRAKRQERVYQRTDTHWNARGAFVATQCAATALNGWFPAVRPLRRSDYADVVEDARGGDLAGILAVADQYHEERLDLRPLAPPRSRRVADVPLPSAPPDWPDETKACFATECDAPDLPTAVVLQDSFGDALRPFLSEHFRRAVYQDGRRMLLDWKLVDHEKPDVVIYELVERVLVPLPAATHKAQ